MMTREYGPYQLGPVDLLIATNALRFLVLPPRSRIFWIAISLVLPIIAIANAIQADWIGFWIMASASGLFLVLGPLWSGRKRTKVVLRVTENGLLAITDDTENLYKSIDVARMRTVLGRLLIPVSKLCVVIAPAHAIGEAHIVELEARIREYAARLQPAA